MNVLEALFPRLWEKKNRDIGEHKKSRHAKFQWIPSNLKNSNEIGTYASLPRSPSIVCKSATHDAITHVFRLIIR